MTQLFAVIELARDKAIKIRQKYHLMHPIFCFFVLETKSFPQIDMTRLSVFETIRLFPSYRFKERKLKVFEDKHASDNSIENE